MNIEENNSGIGIPTVFLYESDRFCFVDNFYSIKLPSPILCPKKIVNSQNFISKLHVRIVMPFIHRQRIKNVYIWSNLFGRIYLVEKLFGRLFLFHHFLVIAFQGLRIEPLTFHVRIRLFDQPPSS